MGCEIEKLDENLQRLKRNEEQMSEEQKIHYAKNLQSFRKKILTGANELLKDFFFGGWRFLKTDEGGMDMVVRLSNQILYEEKKELIRLGRVLLESYSLEKFLDESLLIYYRLFYEAYGKYWIARCEWKEEAKTYYNPIIDMWWENEWGIWIAEYGCSFTLMLPPTKELLEKDYKDQKEVFFRSVQEGGG